jgi:hypothetical protein
MQKFNYLMQSLIVTAHTLSIPATLSKGRAAYPGRQADGSETEFQNKGLSERKFHSG